ncbi:protein RALF-like 34 [Rutidosis leptorrhynchoides]|uniref:protein RALF-like 34 n=1 Tax=Rutidosis leptorrhynchoides TaxID=125765 RepID=UPI003A995B88
MGRSILLYTQITLCLLLFSLTRSSRAEVSVLTGDFDWPTMYDDDGVDDIEVDTDGDVSGGRRSLFWQRMRYYISYGALSANRVPCPPRSGRSYYTHDCWRARGPVHPYTRGCSAITRCRR